MMIRCLNCNGQTKIIKLDKNVRRRICYKCAHKFSTIEIPREVKDKIKDAIELIDEILET